MEAVPALAENRFSPCIEGPPVTQFCPIVLQHYGLSIIFKRSFDLLCSSHSEITIIFYCFPERVNTELVGGYLLILFYFEEVYFELLTTGIKRFFQVFKLTI